MKIIVASILAALLAGCGVETAGTAATAAALKKQELEQGKNTMQRAQEKIDAAAKLEQQSASQSAAQNEEK